MYKFMGTDVVEKRRRSRHGQIGSTPFAEKTRGLVRPGRLVAVLRLYSCDFHGISWLVPDIIYFL